VFCFDQTHALAIRYEDAFAVGTGGRNVDISRVPS